MESKAEVICDLLSVIETTVTALQLLAKNSYIEFHENLEHGLVRQ